MRKNFTISLFLLKEWFRQWLGITIIGSGFALLIIFWGLNAPVQFDHISGKVIRLAPIDSDHNIGTRVYVEIDGGREVMVSLPISALPPRTGDTISIAHFTHRFIGETFDWE